jgi:hypothetical protein
MVTTNRMYVCVCVCACVCVYMCVCTCVCVYRETRRDFKELAYAIMESGKAKICKLLKRLVTQGRDNVACMLGARIPPCPGEICLY